MWNVSGKSPRLLLVEDAPFLRTIFGRVLREHGFEVMEATDGHEALACIKDFRPQLVLTDLGMPVMDGLELIQRLRSNPSTAHVPVVAITADPSNQAEVKARAAGAVDFVIKPIDLSTLLDRLRAIPV